MTSWRKRTMHWTPARVLVLGFLSIITIGTCILKLPISLAAGHSLSFIDALFTATSAVCVTGLVVVDIGTTYSAFGQGVIISLVQIGGIGFMSVALLFYLMLGKRISLRERLILQESINANSMEGIVRTIRRVIIFVFIIQGVGTIILTLRWAIDMPLLQSFYYGLFHSISLFNNGGFDLFGSSFQLHVDDFVTNVVATFLVLSGGLGFIVLAELYDYPKSRRLTLHSKVVLSMTSILVVAGAIFIFIFEFQNTNTLGSLGWDGKIYASFFQSISARSSGTTTVDVANMKQVTQFGLIILMFIGASPGSAGGGIKTTTFAILLAAVYAMLRGREDAVLFRHRLAKDQIIKALTIIFLAIFMVLGVSMLLAITEDQPFITLLFETVSAVATVGLSMGLTPEMSAFGKFVICATMFIGRIGPMTLAYALGNRKEQSLYRYPEGKIMIG
ncbi:TrkH family potassium uptake protein [Paenibacillus alvei]|uniref:TrkH family potassium uptake protein n=2 Tax=Paenibacillus TaxID=44249 RepID=A0ABT4GS63_PAEAL|nr:MULTISPECIES: TrkH family potassium uptake protein [Paenibacillus]EJW18567.1 Ktr system potassium uptake protein B [Paenibacillus alvei DSM 29]MCY7485101.1 TrkH family potassium uptake protein [Paenibacillus alvei]MCY9539731.1 TrkH family potassium uptake protein [Paenibacillus alvei]MCY9703254.1 TrkH family potassium uptake protein [Paenibacillus alvei]MCY9735526.1 TrkH family potassium uptake protein [Paenibacillus alvei]